MSAKLSNFFFWLNGVDQHLMACWLFMFLAFCVYEFDFDFEFELNVDAHVNLGFRFRFPHKFIIMLLACLLC